MPYRNLAQGLNTLCIAFDGDERIAEGTAEQVAVAVKRRIESEPDAQILIFDDATSLPVEIDFEGSEEDVLRAIDSWAPKPSMGPGRPKLGVVAREVTLLPRHWEWLAEQPGGASVTLRRLVEEARKSGKEAGRLAQESAYRFLVTMGGDRPHFEEASRALFANDAVRFAELTEEWATDVRDRVRELAARAFETHWDEAPSQ